MAKQQSYTHALTHADALKLQTTAAEQGVYVEVVAMVGGYYALDFGGSLRAMFMMQAVDMIKQMVASKVRYVNVTTIDSEGSPTSCQVQSRGCDEAAMEYLVKRVKDGHEQPGVWYRPAIYAFMFDTQTRELRRYSIDGTKIERVTTSI